MCVECPGSLLRTLYLSTHWLLTTTICSGSIVISTLQKQMGHKEVPAISSISCDIYPVPFHLWGRSKHHSKQNHTAISSWLAFFSRHLVSFRACGLGENPDPGLHGFNPYMKDENYFPSTPIPWVYRWGDPGPPYWAASVDFWKLEPGSVDPVWVFNREPFSSSIMCAGLCCPGAG